MTHLCSTHSLSCYLFHFMFHSALATRSLALVSGRPILVSGPVGCGKTTTVEHFAAMQRDDRVLKLQMGDQVPAQSPLTPSRPPPPPHRTHHQSTLSVHHHHPSPPPPPPHHSPLTTHYQSHHCFTSHHNNNHPPRTPTRPPCPGRRQISSGNLCLHRRSRAVPLPAWNTRARSDTWSMGAGGRH